MYGLNDAPLAWQLALAEYFGQQRNAHRSVFDDCFFFWVKRPGEIQAIGASHVDDNSMAASKQRLNTEFNAFDKQFGGATRHGLPFTHTGIVYRDTKCGRTQEQDEFCQKLKPYSLTKERARQESSKLTPAELTGFRAILGGLLWLCQTRLDLICEVVMCQQHVSEATVKHLKMANSVVTKAKKYSSNYVEKV